MYGRCLFWSSWVSECERSSRGGKEKKTRSTHARPRSEPNDSGQAPRKKTAKRAYFSEIGFARLGARGRWKLNETRVSEARKTGKIGFEPPWLRSRVFQRAWSQVAGGPLPFLFPRNRSTVFGVSLQGFRARFSVLEG